ncbi:DUF6447 family protein [Marinobacterium alkalitolerans]|uniref:DUF6447 family protein n=1 Tax=Marinobacterium alkalitolerans TaxID=1542925 RepID=UPI001F2A428F|nr:DUF6447 family protein [Marinobacterium alkalitolerans]
MNTQQPVPSTYNIKQTKGKPMATITIDDKEYNLEDLSENARAQIGSMRVADQEIASLQSKMALAQTARNAYARQLAASLPEKEATANKKKDVITIDGKKYNAADFTDNAKQQIAMLRRCDQKLATLQAENAIAQTARNAYAAALKAALAG